MSPQFDTSPCAVRPLARPPCGISSEVAQALRDDLDQMFGLAGLLPREAARRAVFLGRLEAAVRGVPDAVEWALEYHGDLMVERAS